MKAGRELDRLVAERIMGWKYVREHGTEIIEMWPPNGAVRHKDDPVPPHYSTNIAAAWEVVDAIRYKHGGHLLHLHRNGDDTWWAIFGEDEDVGVTADTAPHAICLAALKAAGVST